ncbi:MAG: DUF3996 domain-containing protein [Treponema sp.]|nr:DUF3996 domain-containing protein [Treponema sp.]
MKKFLLVVALAAVFSAGAVFADHPSGWGVGLMGRGGWGYGDFGMGGGASLSLKAPSLPIYWGIDMDLGSHFFGLGVSGDYYFIDNNLVDKTIGWYLGLGAFAGISFWNNYGGYNDYMGLTVGGRLPIGLSFQFPVVLNGLEVFVAAVPKLGGAMWLGHRSGGGLFFNVGGELGVRLWF